MNRHLSKRLVAFIVCIGGLGGLRLFTICLWIIWPVFDVGMLDYPVLFGAVLMAAFVGAFIAGSAIDYFTSGMRKKRSGVWASMGIAVLSFEIYSIHFHGSIEPLESELPFLLAFFTFVVTACLVYKLLTGAEEKV